MFPGPAELGRAAANAAAQILQDAIARRNKARVFVATGNSQLQFMEALVQHSEVNWQAVEAFHLDEYVGLPPTHPSSFRYWIRTRFEKKVHPGRMHYIEGDALDLNREIARYAALIREEPFDLGFVGIGENGHIAFNDPPVADFEDPAILKRVVLDEACRRQQAGEGHFDGMENVPREAITVTCSTLLQVHTWVCCVPDLRKARAVRDSLLGPVTTACPGSLVQRHPRSLIYLDAASASLLPG